MLGRCLRLRRREKGGLAWGLSARFFLGLETKLPGVVVCLCVRSSCCGESCGADDTEALCGGKRALFDRSD